MEAAARSSNSRRLVLEFSRWHLRRAVPPSLTIDGPGCSCARPPCREKFTARPRASGPHVRARHQRSGWRCLFQLFEQRETLSPTARSAFYLCNTAQNNPRVVPDVNRVALHGVFSVACRAVFFFHFLTWHGGSWGKRLSGAFNYLVPLTATGKNSGRHLSILNISNPSKCQ